MRFLKPLIFLAFSVLPLAAHALELDNMTAAEQQAFRAEIRAYLLDNPEVLIEAMSVYDQRQQSREDQADQQMLSDNAQEIYDDGISFVGGNPDGDLTVVEFMDYRCAFCRKAHDQVKQLIRDDGNIRFVIKEYPILGPNSDASSKLAFATLQLFGKKPYAVLYDELMTFNGPMNDVSARRLLGKAGVDAEAVLAKVDSPEVADHINRMHALGQILQVTGTPTFIFGNQIVRGYVPLDAMIQIAAAARAVNN